MCAISIILNITAIVLFSRHKLTPVIYLVFQCIKAAFWTAIAVLIILASLEYYLSIATVVLMVVFLGTSFGFDISFHHRSTHPRILMHTDRQLIYGSVIFHCHRKGKLSRRGRYAGVEDGPELANDDLPPRGSYAAYNPHNIAPLQPSSLANREPAPDYSGTSALQHPTTMHPAMRPIGAPAEYYDASAAQPLYELQGTAYGDR